VLDVQSLLTKYGCSIKTRLGMHPVSREVCSQNGLILIEFMDDADDEAAKLEEELSKMSSVVVRKMVF
jgi:hypothetical protein